MTHKGYLKTKFWYMGESFWFNGILAFSWSPVFLLVMSKSSPSSCSEGPQQRAAVAVKVHSSDRLLALLLVWSSVPFSRPPLPLSRLHPAYWIGFIAVSENRNWILAKTRFNDIDPPDKSRVGCGSWSAKDSLAQFYEANPLKTFKALVCETQKHTSSVENEANISMTAEFQSSGIILIKLESI